MPNRASQETLPPHHERRAGSLTDVERTIAVGLIQGRSKETITTGVSASFGLPAARVERDFDELHARLRHMGLID